MYCLIMCFPLNLQYARQSIGELLVAAYPENAFLDDQKEASVSMHDHTPHFLLVAILYGYQQNEYFAIFLKIVLLLLLFVSVNFLNPHLLTSWEFIVGSLLIPMSKLTPKKAQLSSILSCISFRFYFH